MGVPLLPVCYCHIACYVGFTLAVSFIVAMVVTVISTMVVGVFMVTLQTGGSKILGVVRRQQSINTLRSSFCHVRGQYFDNPELLQIPDTLYSRFLLMISSADRLSSGARCGELRRDYGKRQL